MQKRINLLLFYVLLFLLFYFDPIEIGGIKFAIIWKIPILVVLSFISIKSLVRNTHVEKLVLWQTTLSFKYFFSVSSFPNIISSFTLFSKSIVFALFMSSLKKIFTNKQLEYIAKHTAIFIILSFIPFIIGIIEPLSEGYQLDRFEQEGFGFIGVFQRPHSAAIHLGFALIIILYYLLESRKTFTKIFYVFLLFLGSYSLTETFVRTGWVMFGFAALILLFYKKNLFFYLKASPLIILFIAFLYFQFKDNKAIEYRLEDNNQWNEEASEGSGRLIYWESAINNWWNEGSASIFIGLGNTYALDLMEEDIGKRLFAHNGFIQILQTQGLIGISLYLLFLFQYIKRILRKKKSKLFILNLSLLLAYLVYMMFQGGDYFFIYLFICIYLIIPSNIKDN